eukprot:s53_g21.t1
MRHCTDLLASLLHGLQFTEARGRGACADQGPSMAPPKLPAIAGRQGGLDRSASQPRIEAKHRLQVPDFRRGDISDSLQEIGQLSRTIIGPGGVSKSVRALTKSASTPELRTGPLKASDAARRVMLFGAPLQLEGSATASVSDSAQMSFSELGGGAYPPSTTCARPPQELPPEVPAMQEDTLDYMKPAEEAHYNFRNLPLEIFDHAEDFEVKTPQEWMAEVQKDDSRPQACVVHYKAKKWIMAPCWVLRYEEAINRYIVEMEDASQKKVKRLSLRFNAEDPANFERRVETCRGRKAWCELQEAFIDYIEHKDDKLVTPFSRSMKEFFIRSCLEKCSLDEPNSHASTIRELMAEVEANYMLSMKLFNVKVELIPLMSTKEAYLPDELNTFSLKFAPVMQSFLPSPCPESGLVEHARPEMRVQQLVAEMQQMPLLGSSIFAITCQVWRRYINEVARMELVDTTRVGGVDVTRQRKLIKKADSIIFEPQDMFEHQKSHIERITNHLKRGWRDYIIAEVLDKLSDDYNFFSDDTEKHMQSPLHALLRKLDLIINSQLRWFVQNSMESWCNFLNTFVPDPKTKRPTPLIYLDLEADNDEIYLEPEPQDFLNEFESMLRDATKSISIVKTMEAELMPFTNIEEKVLYTPECSPDGDDVEYQPPGMSDLVYGSAGGGQAWPQALTSAVTSRSASLLSRRSLPRPVSAASAPRARRFRTMARARQLGGPWPSAGIQMPDVPLGSANVDEIREKLLAKAVAAGRLPPSAAEAGVRRTSLPPVYDGHSDEVRAAVEAGLPADAAAQLAQLAATRRAEKEQRAQELQKLAKQAEQIQAALAQGIPKVQAELPSAPELESQAERLRKVWEAQQKVEADLQDLIRGSAEQMGKGKGKAFGKWPGKGAATFAGEQTAFQPPQQMQASPGRPLARPSIARQKGTRPSMAGRQLAPSNFRRGLVPFLLLIAREKLGQRHVPMAMPEEPRVDASRADAWHAAAEEHPVEAPAQAESQRTEPGGVEAAASSRVPSVPAAGGGFVTGAPSAATHATSAALYPIDSEMTVSDDRGAEAPAEAGGAAPADTGAGVSAPTGHTEETPGPPGLRGSTSSKQTRFDAEPPEQHAISTEQPAAPPAEEKEVAKKPSRARKSWFGGGR